jgi:hypothetical protein
MNNEIMEHIPLNEHTASRVAKFNKMFISNYKPNEPMRYVGKFDYGELLENDQRVLSNAKKSLEATTRVINSYIKNIYGQDVNVSELEVSDVLDVMIESFEGRAKQAPTYNDREYLTSNGYLKDNYLYIIALDLVESETPTLKTRAKFEIKNVIKDCIKLSLKTQFIKTFKFTLDSEWVFYTSSVIDNADESHGSEEVITLTREI